MADDETSDSGETSMFPEGPKPPLMSPCTTRVIPFDGIGIDPTVLIGRRISTCYRTWEPACLNLLFTDGGLYHLLRRGHQDLIWNKELVDDDDQGLEDFFTRISYDPDIKEALGQGGFDQGRNGATRTLVNTYSAVGERESEMTEGEDDFFRRREHRVIGVAFVGMEELSFFEYRFEYSDVASFHDYILRFDDLVLTDRPILKVAPASSES